MALAYTLFFMLRYGYQFASGDHEEHLPPIYKLVNPSLYQNDFFMNGYESAFNIRFFFVQLFYYLQKFIDIEILFFSVWLLCLFSLGFIWQKIAYIVTENITASLLTPFFVLFVFYAFTLGSNHITYNILIGGVIAKVFASFGIYYFLKRRFVVSGFLFGFGALFQVLSALQPFVILALFLIFEFKKSELKNLIIFSSTFCIVGLFILIPVFGNYFTSVSVQEKRLFEQILFTFRAPWHYMPSAFTLGSYLKFLMVLIVVLAGIIKTKTNYKNVVLNFSVVFIVVAIIYSVTIELFNNFSLAKLQWFKASMWVCAFASVYASYFFSQLISKINSSFKPKTIVIAALLFAFIFSFTVFNFSFPSSLRNKIKIGNYIKTDLEIVQQWINNNLANDALFITFPEDNSFSCNAKRSLVVSPHAFIHTVNRSIAWYYLYSNIYGVNFNNNSINFRKNLYINIPDSLKNNVYVLYRLNHDSLINCEKEIIKVQGNLAVAKVY
ncbi:MAG: hypothetical protein ACK4K9_08850 [Bacteroidia bacterium]